MNQIHEYDRVVALAEHLGCALEDVTPEPGLDNTFSAEGKEWLVLTDVEADEAAEDEIKSSLWAFKLSFVRSHSEKLREAGDRALEALEKAQGSLCEDFGPILEALVDDLDDLIADAIRADGRGHFLAGYDGEEREHTGDDGETWFIYAV